MKHPCPSNTRHWLRQFLVIYHCLDKGGAGLWALGVHSLSEEGLTVKA